MGAGIRSRRERRGRVSWAGCGKKNRKEKEVRRAGPEEEKKKKRKKEEWAGLVAEMEKKRK